ncbi:MAG: type II toxin-antitoxin system RelE/ParE family toxin [Pseudonocardiaceae bacterium]
MPWEIFLTDEVNGWLDELATVDDDSYRQVVYAIEALAEVGPNLGRPLADRIKGSAVHNLKELRPGSAGATEVRILFVFDPWRSAILLVAGDKASNWTSWYRQAIPHAEQLYETYLKERATEQEPPP